MEKDIGSDYGNIISEFLRREISIEEFQNKYMDLFKNEERDLSEPAYQVLNELFADADAYTTDEKLILEHPEFYIDEKTLRQKASLALSKITKQSGLEF